MGHFVLEAARNLDQTGGLARAILGILEADLGSGPALCRGRNPS